MSKKGKNFFYRIEPMAVLSEMICVPESERGAWAVQFFKDLQKGDTDSVSTDLAADIIREAHEYRNRRANAGQQGGIAKASKGVAKGSNATISGSNEVAISSKQLAVNSNNTETILASKEATPPPHLLFHLWNKIIDSPKATEMNKGREGKCRVRLQQRTLEEWETIFKRIKDTPFCCGDNDRGWRADFDWIISNDTNAAKIMEGKYDKVDQKPAVRVPKLVM